MNITAIIILHSSNIELSKTIQSLLNSNIKGINLNVIIWNNGPTQLTIKECEKYKIFFDTNKIQLSIYENIQNIALSKIYNFFIQKFQKYNFFTILDQDSILNTDFFQNIKLNSDFDIIVPAIYSAGWRSKENSLCFPVYIGTNNLLDKKTFVMGEIESISSGLTLSNKLVTYLSNTKRNIFNECYALYAIDISFFRDLKSLRDIPFKGLCIGKVNHSLDFNLQDRQKISPVRKLEMEYSKVLNKIYYDKKSRLNVFLYLLRRVMRKEYSFLAFLKLIKCLIRKKHPRACINFTMNKLL